MSIASVTVDNDAHSDQRIAFLGELAGYSRYEAFGRLVMLWGRCTFLQTDKPGDLEIKSCLGVRGLDALVESGLGEVTPEGVRVRGRFDNRTGKDRFAWYRAPSQQSAAGVARAASAPRRANGKFTSGQPALDQRTSSGPPADSSGSPAPVQVQEEDQRSGVCPPEDHERGSHTSPSGASETEHPETHTHDRSRSAEPDHDPEPGSHRKFLEATRVPHRPDVAAVRKRLHRDAWNYAALRHSTVGADGIEPDAPPWPMTPAAKWDPCVELDARIDELLAMGDEASAKAALARRVDVAEAIARRDGHRRFMSPSCMWERKAFARDAQQSVAQIKRGFSGPRLVEQPKPRYRMPARDDDMPPLGPDERSKGVG